MYRLFFKRFFDIVLSLLAILISSPIWIITVIGIEISDPGPIFYKACRIGKDNREFKMLKFRSMRVLKNPKEGSEASLRPETDRIFPWGKIIRKLKIDELPQFLNAFVGNMSIVGPRPVAKDQFDIFRVGRYDEAKKVRPGITGPAALYDYIYGDQFEEADINEYIEKVLPTRKELELVYVKKQSFIYDIKIVWYTVVCVLASIFKKEPKRIYTELVGSISITKEGELEEVHR